MTTNGNDTLTKVLLGCTGVILTATLTISCLGMSKASEAKSMSYANDKAIGEMRVWMKHVDGELREIKVDVKSILRREVAQCEGLEGM